MDETQKNQLKMVYIITWANDPKGFKRPPNDPNQVQ
jgi:hypothetical protein